MSSDFISTGEYDVFQKVTSRSIGIRLHFDDKSATLDFRGTLLFKAEAGCLKINSRLFGLMTNTITISNIYMQ